MLKLLKRVTSSGKSIPYIDGLRFFAVASVFMFHYLDWYRDHRPDFTSSLSSRLDYLYGNALYGVMLFFGISGFVLSLSFYDIFTGNKKFHLKNYLFRRLTRLEPPYIAQLLLFTAVNVFLGGKAVSYVLPHFLASLFYVHNFIYDSKPIINPVLWTLEIEIQFYLLAPIFCLLFKLKKWLRRIIFLLLIFVLPIVTPHLSFPTILDYYQYFLVGILAVDFYKNEIAGIGAHWVFDVLCLISILNIWNPVSHSFGFILSVLCVLVFSGKTIVWKRIVESNLLVVIGGMCYTIYMLHQKTIFYAQAYLSPGKLLGGSIDSDFFLRLLVAIFATAVVSVLFFIFIERPTMKPKWWKIKNFKTLFLN